MNFCLSMVIAIIATGGTISSVKEHDGLAKPKLKGEDIVELAPEVNDLIDYEIYNFSTIGSPEFSIDQMFELTELIQKLSDKSNIDGIIVTQGTATLEEVSYFVDLCYQGEKPVVFTGAMRNPSLVSSDGPINLLSSVHTVMDERSHALGVLVVSNNRIIPARDVVKVHTSNIDAFRSPEFGPIATVDEDRLYFRRLPSSGRTIFSPKQEDLTERIIPIVITVDMDTRQIADARNYEGVCLATMGGGGIPPKIIPDLERITDDGIPIVATSRCPEGRLLRSTYSTPDSSAQLKKLNIYFSDLNLQKTRIKMVVSMASNALDDAFPRPS